MFFSVIRIQSVIVLIKLEFFASLSICITSTENRITFGLTEAVQISWSTVMSTGYLGIKEIWITEIRKGYCQGIRA